MLHFVPHDCCYAWERCILKNPSVQIFHDVKWRSDDCNIFTEAVDLWYWNICLFEGMNDTVLSVDLVCCPREELAWGLLPQYILLPIVCGQLIGRV